MPGTPHWTETFTLTGTGDGFASVECYLSPARGVINTIKAIRGAAGITQVDSIWFVRDIAISLGDSTPNDDYVVAEGAVIPITASDTVRSASTDIYAPPFFNRGLGIIVDVTASGAWQLYVTIEFADLEGALG